MSFYGSSLNIVPYSFAKINIKNNEQTTAIEAKTTDAQFTLEGDNNPIKISSNNSNIKIEHKDTNNIISPNDFILVEEPPANANVVQLNDNDCLKLTSLIYNKQGHVTGEKVSYFRLQQPSEIQADISAIETIIYPNINDKSINQVDINEKNIATNSSNISTNKTSIDGINNKLNNSQSGLNATYTLTSNINSSLGDLKKVYGDKETNLASSLGDLTSVYGTGDGANLSKILGSFDTFNETFSGKSFVGAMIANNSAISGANAIAGQAFKLAEKLEVTIANLSAEIDDLKARIEELENSNKETT